MKETFFTMSKLQLLKVMIWIIKCYSELHDMTIFVLSFSPKQKKRILLSRVMAGNGRFCSSYEVSPSSFRYYSSSVEFLAGISQSKANMLFNDSSFLVWKVLLFSSFFRFQHFLKPHEKETLWLVV